MPDGLLCIMETLNITSDQFAQSRAQIIQDIPNMSCRAAWMKCSYVKGLGSMFSCY